VVGFIALVRMTSNTDCKRYETREVEMIRQGKFNNGTSKHQYKVCVE
jgi:hypothetical protein